MAVAHLGVAVETVFCEPGLLDGSGLSHPHTDDGRGFGRGVAGDFFVLKARDVDMNVDPVEKRAGYFFQVAANVTGDATTLLGGVAVIAAWAPVHVIPWVLLRVLI